MPTSRPRNTRRSPPTRARAPEPDQGYAVTRRLVLATRNAHKVGELREILADVLADLDLQIVVKARHVAHAKPRVRVAQVPRAQSFGQLAGLHGARDALDLKSSVALVVDQDTQEVLFQKNESAVLPIASITKLMTGLLISEAKLPMEEMIAITQDDVDTEKGSSSRLRVGTELSRGELLHLALMSSENRAAHALGRSYPGGLAQFVALMNVRAKTLGMHDTRYVEPTGLSSKNQSSARDLAKP